MSYVRTKEHLEAQSRIQTGKKRSKETRRNIGLASKGRKHTEETKRNISNALKGRKLSKEHKRKISESHKGIKQTEESKKKLSKANKGRKRSIISREKQSKTVIEKIKNGEIIPNTSGIDGEFYSKKNRKKIHYRSLLELCWYKQLEKTNRVKKYQVEPCVIPYKFEKIIKHYLPDLRIVYTDGTSELVEIKPESGKSIPKNIAKWKAAKAWCKTRKRNITFKVIGYEELKVC